MGTVRLKNRAVQFVALSQCLFGPRLPTWALQQVGSYLRYIGHEIFNVIVTAAVAQAVRGLALNGQRACWSSIKNTSPQATITHFAAQPSLVRIRTKGMTA